MRLYVPGSSDVDPPRRAFVEQGGVAVAPGTAGSAVITGADVVELDAPLLLSGAPQDIGANEIVLVPDAVSQVSDERLADLAGVGVRLVALDDVLAAVAGAVRDSDGAEPVVGSAPSPEVTSSW